MLGPKVPAPAKTFYIIEFEFEFEFEHFYLDTCELEHFYLDTCELEHFYVYTCELEHFWYIRSLPTLTENQIRIFEINDVSSIVIFVGPVPQKCKNRPLQKRHVNLQNLLYVSGKSRKKRFR